MARLPQVLLVHLLSCVALGFALDITGKVAWSDVCPDAASLGRARVSLDDGTYNGGIMHDGKFVIPDVPDGTYILSLISHDHSFDQLRIDINNSTTEVRPYVSGTPMTPPSPVLLPYPVVFTPREKHTYFVPPESFNIISMLSNPMMLLMVFGGGMMLAMPYLIKNMDPETLEDFKEQQGRMTGIQNAFQSGDLKSGLNALMAGEEPGSSQSNAATSSNKVAGGTKARGSKKVKR
ncbi:hypothetical protein B0H34DRAFT_683677, partial [Crassisporium funariophilum]